MRNPRWSTGTYVCDGAHIGCGGARPPNFTVLGMRRAGAALVSPGALSHPPSPRPPRALDQQHNNPTDCHTGGGGGGHGTMPEHAAHHRWVALVDPAPVGRLGHTCVTVPTSDVVVRVLRTSRSRSAGARLLRVSCVCAKVRRGGRHAWHWTRGLCPPPPPPRLLCLCLLCTWQMAATPISGRADRRT